MHKLMGAMLRENNIGFAELNGKVPVSKRGDLIRRFETNDSCKVFLSTEAGGSGLNLQVADILINFELPWNPAKKNQRIGRIDRIGQKNSHLTIFNLITTNSIKTRISLGLLAKQSLFDGVLNKANQTNFVDFSEKGRSQFLNQVAEMVDALDHEEEELEEVREVEDSGKAERQLEEEGLEVAGEDSEGGQNGGMSVTSVNGREDRAKKMEAVMNSGIQFLAGLMEMSSGTKIDVKDQKIEVNPTLVK